METKFVVTGWDNPPMQIRNNSGPGVAFNPRYIRVIGGPDFPPPPNNASRAAVYRWLAELEEKEFETEICMRP